MPTFDTTYADRVADCLKDYVNFIAELDLGKCQERGLLIVFQDLDAMFKDFVQKAPEERTEADIGRAEGILNAMKSLCAKCMKENGNADI